MALGVEVSGQFDGRGVQRQQVAAQFLSQFLGEGTAPRALLTPTAGRQPYTEMLRALDRVSDEYHVNGVTSQRTFRDETLPRVSVIVWDNGVVHVVSETAQGDPLNHALFWVREDGSDLDLQLLGPTDKTAAAVWEEAEQQGITIVREVIYEPITYTVQTHD